MGYNELGKTGMFDKAWLFSLLDLVCSKEYCL